MTNGNLLYQFLGNRPILIFLNQIMQMQYNLECDESFRCPTALVTYLKNHEYENMAKNDSLRLNPIQHFANRNFRGGSESLGADNSEHLTMIYPGICKNPIWSRKPYGVCCKYFDL